MRMHLPTEYSARAGRWPVNSAGPSWGTVRARRDGLGHRHLNCLLRVHHVLREAGVAEAVTTLTMHRVAEAVAACRYFDLPLLAELLPFRKPLIVMTPKSLLRMPQAATSPDTAAVFDAQYRDCMCRDGYVAEAIRRTVAERAQDFPLGPL